MNQPTTNRLTAVLGSFIGMGIFIVLLALGIIFFSYLFIIGSVIGLILFGIAYLRAKFFMRQAQKQPNNTRHINGRTIDHEQ